MNQETMETMVSLKSHIEAGKAEVERCRRFKKLSEHWEELPEDLMKQCDSIILLEEEHGTACEVVLGELLKQKEEKEKEDEPI